MLIIVQWLRFTCLYLTVQLRESPSHCISHTIVILSFFPFQSYSDLFLSSHCRCRRLLLHMITMTHTHALGRTPLDDRSARRRDVFVATHIPGIADKSLARPTSRYILFHGENISFDTRLVIYTNSTNIPPIMIIHRIYETQYPLSL
jgi:hypothetical protein